MGMLLGWINAVGDQVSGIGKGAGFTPAWIWLSSTTARWQSLSASSLGWLATQSRGCTWAALEYKLNP